MSDYCAWMRSPRFLACCVALAIALTPVAAQAHSHDAAPMRVHTAAAPDGTIGTWSAVGSGIDDTVWTLTRSDSGVIYAGGDITAAGGSPARGVAAWNGTTWSPVGGGLANSAYGNPRLVSSLAWSAGRLYAVGSFTTSGLGNTEDTGLAVFDGSTWSPVGGGLRLSVDRLLPLGVAVDDSLVYVAGELIQAGPLPDDDSAIAMWDGTSWSNLAGGFPRAGQYARAMAVAANGDLIAGGKFTQAGPGIADDTNIARWDGTAWHPLGNGVGDGSTQTYSVAIAADDSIYVGGNFLSASNGAVATRGIARWDGTTWSRMGSGSGINSGSVRTITPDVAHDVIYMTGSFTTMDGITVNRVVLWDEVLKVWVPFASGGSTGTNGTVESFALNGSDVYVGGWFTSAGPVSGTTNIAKWTWDAPEGTNTLAGNPGDTVALTGEGFIGVPRTGGVYFGGVPSPSYTRDDTTSFSNVVVPSGIAGTVSIEVDAVGGRASIGTFTAPTPAPPAPANPPANVAATAGNAAAEVSWSAPASPGSYPVTTYQATSSPEAHVCLVAAPALSCEVTGLRNGTTYTFTVTALNGAGWSAPSLSSNAVVPTAPPRPTITIAGTREGKLIEVTGSTTGMGMGAILKPWTRMAGAPAFTEGAGRILVDMRGNFAWSRKANAKIHVYIATVDGAVRSNVVTIPG